MSELLLTGGSGRLGTALRGLVPGLLAPGRDELDVTDFASVRGVLERLKPGVVVHAAAYTNVGGAELEREACWRANVGGTRNLVRATQALGIGLVHISTDYVFWGDAGGYKEDDPLGPVRNYYALSKLAAEEVVRLHPGHLVIRTSFRPSPFPYPQAFDDLFTGQDYTEVIAPEIALALGNLGRIPHDTLHVVTERKSAYELARRTRPDVQPASRLSSPVPLPEDISLDTSRWQELKRGWNPTPEAVL